MQAGRKGTSQTRAAAEPTAVLISVNGESPVLYEVLPQQVLRIGRAPSSDIVLSSNKVSGFHLELVQDRSLSAHEVFARDTSTNSTGVRRTPTDEWEELSHGELRQLPHGSDLLVPFRTAPASEKKRKKKEKGEQRMRLTVQYLYRPSISHLNAAVHRLPDAYDLQTGKGRWRYCDRLGEGGLGIVYRAFDMVGDLGTVAIKVSKWSADTAGTRNAQDAWQVFIMHREAQWSLHCLHQPRDERYNAGLADLFVRYLEDHTGFPSYSTAGEFEAVRALYEAADLNWSTMTFDPPLPSAPYVVMELVFGRPISAMKPESFLSNAERHSISRQAVSALGYLGSFGLLHRDFRTSNIHITGRGDLCRIKVLDLGLMIVVEQHHMMNPNLAVKACWHRRQRDYDWVPPEVKMPPHPNFKLPAHSFDIFSLGIFMLRLYGGKPWTKELLQLEHASSRWHIKLEERNLQHISQLLRLLLGRTTLVLPSIDPAHEMLLPLWWPPLGRS